MSTDPKPTKQQQREEMRAKQLESFKKKQAAQKRNRLFGILLAVGGAVAVLAIVAVVIVVNIQPAKLVPDVSSSLEVQTWDDLQATHVVGKVDYEMDPPAGGPHDQAWLNCGVYSQPQTNENAVHALEHGAVWITYDPALPADEVAELRERTPTTYAVLSPYPDIPAPIVISAWGAQLQFNDPADPRLDDFIDQYWQSPDAPEPGAACTGAVTGPGLVTP